MFKLVFADFFAWCWTLQYSTVITAREQSSKHRRISVLVVVLVASKIATQTSVGNLPLASWKPFGKITSKNCVLANLFKRLKWRNPNKWSSKYKVWRGKGICCFPRSQYFNFQQWPTFSSTMIFTFLWRDSQDVWLTAQFSHKRRVNFSITWSEPNIPKGSPYHICATTSQYPQELSQRKRLHRYPSIPCCIIFKNHFSGIIICLAYRPMKTQRPTFMILC